MFSSNNVGTVKATCKCQTIVGFVNPGGLTEDLFILCSIIKAGKACHKCLPGPQQTTLAGRESSA